MADEVDASVKPPKPSVACAPRDHPAPPTGRLQLPACDQPELAAGDPCHCAIAATNGVNKPTQRTRRDNLGDIVLLRDTFPPRARRWDRVDQLCTARGGHARRMAQRSPAAALSPQVVAGPLERWLTP
jgi:hypothetical protein